MGEKSCKIHPKFQYNLIRPHKIPVKSKENHHKARLDALTIGQSDQLQPSAVLVRASGHSLGGALVSRSGMAGTGRKKNGDLTLVI